MEFSLPFVIYLIETALPANIIPPFGLGVMLSCVAALALGATFILNEPYSDEERKRYLAAWKRSLSEIKIPYITTMLIWFLLAATGELVPSKDSAYRILAAYGVQEAYVAASGSEEVQQIASKSLQLIEQSLDRYLEAPVEEVAEEK